MNYLKEYLNYLKIDKNLSQITIEIYKRDILEFYEYLDRRQSIKRAKRTHIRGFLCFLNDKNNSPITRRRKITALKNFFEFLKDENLIKKNPVSLITMPKVLQKEPSYLSEKDVRKVLNVIQSGEKRFKKRDYIMFRLLVETGIRLNELTNLKVSDFDFNNLTFSVLRKGGGNQEIILNKNLGNILKIFVKNKKNESPVFISNCKRRISNRRVGLILKAYIKDSGIKKKGISVHSLRHGFCSRLLSKGVDIKTIQILAGHKNISTTERYLHITKSKLRKEVRLAEI
jgi:site-specific recombinase XerD